MKRPPIAYLEAAVMPLDRFSISDLSDFSRYGPNDRLACLYFQLGFRESLLKGH
jgi:hypothetical protein